MRPLILHHCLESLLRNGWLDTQFFLSLTSESIMTGLQAACGYSYSRVDVPQSSTAETNAICTSKIKQGQTYDHCLFKATNVCVNLGFKLV